MSGFATLVVVAFLAFLAPGISRRVRLPVVVGEIALGLLVGLSVYLLAHFGDRDLLSTGDAISFLAGLEIDFTTIEDRGARPVRVGFAGLAAPGDRGRLGPTPIT